METRLKITLMLREIAKFFPIDHKVDISQQIEKFFRGIPKIIDVPCNSMYFIDIVKNIVESRYIDNTQSILLEAYLQRLLLKRAQISPYNLKINKSRKIKKDALKSDNLLYDLNEVFDVIPVAQSALFKHILKEKKRGSSIQWSVGNVLLKRLREQINEKTLDRSLWEQDLLDIKNVDFLCDNLMRITPRISHLANNFTTMRKNPQPSGSNSKILFLVIILILREKVRLLILKSNLTFSSLPEQWKHIMRYYHKWSPFFTENDFQTYKIKNEMFCGDPSDQELQKLISKLRLNILNTLNVYSKVLGIDVTKIYLDKGIITQYGTKKDPFYRLDANLTNVQISTKLPNLVSRKNKDTLYTSYKSNTVDTVKYSISDSCIPNPQMEVDIHDINAWQDSASRLNLNLNFIEDFLQNFISILNNTIEKEGEHGISENQIVFLSAYYNINLSFLQIDNKIFNKVIEYAVNFKDLKKLNITSSIIPEAILKKFLDIIYQKKFTFIQIVCDLPYLLCVDNFTFNFMFDARGRSQPDSSLFTHHHPVLRYFFSWGNHLIYKSENLGIAYLLDQQTTSCSKLITEDDVNMKIDIMHIISCGVRKKLFETVLLYRDYINLSANIPKEFYYSVDASSSGVQINAMLIKSKKLALACGLVKSITTEDVKNLMPKDDNGFNMEHLYPNQDPNIKDLYSLFLIYLENSMNDIYYNAQVFERELFTQSVAVQKFIINHFYKLNSKFYLQLKTDKILFDDLLELYNICDILIEDNTTIEILICRYKLKYESNKIYNLLRKPFKTPQERKIEKEEVKSSTKKLKNKKKEIFINLNKIKLLLIFIEWEYNVLCLNKAKDFIPMVNRKLVKHAIMITFYGGTGKSRRTGFIESCMDQAIENNILLTKNQEQALYNFSIFLDSQMTTWITTEYPEAMYLINIVKESAKKKIFKSQAIVNKHVSWWYKPTSTQRYTKSFYNKDYSVHRFTGTFDYHRIGTAFVANYIQFCDAAICSYVVAELKEQNIPILTSHDCFKCPYQFSYQLNVAIFNAYKKFFTDNCLETHFLETNPFILEKLNTLRINNNLEPFYVNEISSNTIVKF